MNSRPSPTDDSLPAHILLRLMASAAFWTAVFVASAVAYGIKHLWS